jgi:hypothetical protein
VAAILPQTWNFRKLVDRNRPGGATRGMAVARTSVIVSAMIVRKVDSLDAIQTAEGYGKAGGGGGPIATALPGGVGGRGRLFNSG